MYKLQRAGLLVSEALLRNTEIIKFLVTGMLFVMVFWVFTQVVLGWFFSGVVVGYLSWLVLLQVKPPESGE
jgi:F0F1-type ATP synthase assembly protein I